MAKVQLTLYPETVRFLLTFIVPYAFAAYHPVAGLLHKERALVGWLTLPVGSLIFLLGLVVWQQGLARYEGTGS